jgi:hypothetical protein
LIIIRTRSPREQPETIISTQLSSGYTIARHRRNSLWGERKLGPIAATGDPIPG